MGVSTGIIGLALWGTGTAQAQQATVGGFASQTNCMTAAAPPCRRWGKDPQHGRLRDESIPDPGTCGVGALDHPDTTATPRAG